MTTTLSCWRSRPGSDAGQGPRPQVLSALQNERRRVLELGPGAGHSIEEASPVMAMSVSNTKVTRRCVLRMAAGLAQEGR
jgi:hypothetical protein